MYLHFSNLLANSAVQYAARIRLVSMFAVLVVGLVSGYLASNRFGLSEHLAKKIMTVVLVFFSWVIALLVIWPMQLTKQLIWLPVVGVILMLTVTALSVQIGRASWRGRV